MNGYRWIEKELSSKFVWDDFMNRDSYNPVMKKNLSCANLRTEK